MDPFNVLTFEGIIVFDIRSLNIVAPNGVLCKVSASHARTVSFERVGLYLSAGLIFHVDITTDFSLIQGYGYLAITVKGLFLRYRVKGIALDTGVGYMICVGIDHHHMVHIIGKGRALDFKRLAVLGENPDGSL